MPLNLSWVKPDTRCMQRIHTRTWNIIACKVIEYRVALGLYYTISVILYAITLWMSSGETDIDLKNMF